MIIVIGSIIAQADKIPEAVALSLEHVKRSQKEPGCISHNVSVDCENSSRLVFVEEWADMAALQVHFELKASQKFVADLGPIVAAKPDMKIFEASEVPTK